MRSKILLIVEGEVEEPRILGSQGHGLLSLVGADYEVVTYAGSIYELYQSYKKDEFDDIVSYLRNEKGLKINPKVLSKSAFSAIYLIFDYDPHHQKYSDEIIQDLLNIFDNETENGKIYINYPMVESYYHLENLPDDEYNDRKISLVGLNGKKYKKLVNTTTCLKKNNITKRDMCYIIMHNYNKAKIITNMKSKEIDYHKILSVQLENKKTSNEIFVLSTFPLMAIDYNYERALKLLELKLKDNFITID